MSLRALSFPLWPARPVCLVQSTSRTTATITAASRWLATSQSQHDTATARSIHTRRSLLPASSIPCRRRSFHTTPPVSFSERGGRRSPREEEDEGEGRECGGGTDLGSLDVLADAPPPPNAVDRCLADGFRLTSGITVRDGGVLLLNGETFSWKPWGGETGSRPGRLVNSKGQWEVHEAAFGALSVVWPRPDLLVLGVGPEMRPLSPATRRHIGSLGVRVEVLDTRNAAAQYNLLATERGIDQVAAALVPVGWREPS